METSEYSLIHFAKSQNHARKLAEKQRPDTQHINSYDEEDIELKALSVEPEQEGSKAEVQKQWSPLQNPQQLMTSDTHLSATLFGGITRSKNEVVD